MFTHKPTRDGAEVSVNIFGTNGEKFARRIAESALRAGERLGPDVSITDVADGQRFVFAVEPPAVEQPGPAMQETRGLKPRVGPTLGARWRQGELGR